MHDMPMARNLAILRKYVLLTDNEFITANLAFQWS